MKNNSQLLTNFSFSNVFSGWAIFMACLLYPLIADSAIKVSPLARVHFIDVDYGDAILIELPDSQRFLIDAGDKGYGGTLVEYLEKLDIDHIDTAVISHPHSNHFGGFLELLNHFSIDRFFINGDSTKDSSFKELIEQIYIRLTALETVSRGYQIAFNSESLNFSVLHPLELKSTPNGNSLVIWFKYKNTSFLFTGDIEPKEQKEILAAYPQIKDADVVMVPHHGGDLSPEFVNAFKNKILIVSTGANTWGLPKENDLRKLNGRIFRTDRNGTIVIESDGEKLYILPERR